MVAHAQIGGNPETEPPVEPQLRAYPLIELLSAAARLGCDVTWDKDLPAV
ncbi:MAG: DUF1840 family protein [Burkholderiales bacterium]